MLSSRVFFMARPNSAAAFWAKFGRREADFLLVRTSLVRDLIPDNIHRILLVLLQARDWSKS
jgi:hypothetical protein